LGIGRARCPARIEILSRSPTVILDTAHNPASIAALLDLILERFSGVPRLLVFATSADKDASTMLQQLLPHFDQVVFTRYLNNPRATDPDKLLAVAQSLQQSGGLAPLTLHVRPTPEAAWRLIESLAAPTHLVCITGSFFLAAEARHFAESAGRVAIGCS
jgi:dihydrofolate synthase/folylpolyglutamate synthase